VPTRLPRRNERRAAGVAKEKSMRVRLAVVVFWRKTVPLLAIVGLLICAQGLLGQGSGKGSKDSGGGGGSGGAGDNGSTSDASGKGGKGDSSGGSGQYFVEADMLVYEASARIAKEVADELGTAGDKRIVLYDQQSFSNLQAYEAFREMVRVIQNGYQAAQEPSALEPAPTPGGVGFAPTDVLSAVKTGVEILSALRSTTDLTGQKSDPQDAALFAQVAHALKCRRYTVVVPKLVLVPQADSVIDSKDCASTSNTVAGSISCLMDKRKNAEAKSKENIKSSNKDESEVTNTILSKTNTLFDRLLDSLSGSSGKTAPSDLVKNQLAPDSGSPAAPSTSPAPAPSLLSTIMAGRELRHNIDGTSKILYVGFNAAGGSYRVLHNFWIELFWRTPRPAFNGGAVASYILFNPGDSTVEQARTLRFAYNYSKFGSKKMTRPDNFLPVKDSGQPGAPKLDVCADIDPPKKQ
jgi:hypothetical protein